MLVQVMELLQSAPCSLLRFVQVMELLQSAPHSPLRFVQVTELLQSAPHSPLRFVQVTELLQSAPHSPLRFVQVLCLHIKRFRWSTYCRLKLETFVEFPLQGLDMNGYVLNNLHETRGSGAGGNLYDLAAVVVHHGSG